MPEQNTPFEALRFNITSTVLSSDASGTQVVESLLMDNALATVLLAEQTAALAEAQQTANLIAYLNTGPHSWGYHPGEAVLKSVQARIEERLGLA